MEAIKKMDRDGKIKAHFKELLNSKEPEVRDMIARYTEEKG